MPLVSWDGLEVSRGWHRMLRAGSLRIPVEQTIESAGPFAQGPRESLRSSQPVALPPGAGWWNWTDAGRHRPGETGETEAVRGDVYEGRGRRAVAIPAETNRDEGQTCATPIRSPIVNRPSITL